MKGLGEMKKSTPSLHVQEVNTSNKNGSLHTVEDGDQLRLWPGDLIFISQTQRSSWSPHHINITDTKLY